MITFDLFQEYEEQILELNEQIEQIQAENERLKQENEKQKELIAELVEALEEKLEYDCSHCDLYTTLLEDKFCRKDCGLLKQRELLKKAKGLSE